MLFTMITILYGKEVTTNTYGLIDFILPQPMWHSGAWVIGTCGTPD